MTGGKINVSLDALSRGYARGIALVNVPDGEDLVAAGSHLTDQVVVFTVRGSHERRVDAEYADERFVNAGPIAVVVKHSRKRTNKRTTIFLG